MATIAQTGKRAPVANGELYSIGASGTKGVWTSFKITVREDDATDGPRLHKYTTLNVDRKEAERIVKQLSGFLTTKPAEV